jgi:hypothetical protein
MPHYIAVWGKSVRSEIAFDCNPNDDPGMFDGAYHSADIPCSAFAGEADFRIKDSNETCRQVEMIEGTIEMWAPSGRGNVRVGESQYRLVLLA